MLIKLSSLSGTEVAPDWLRVAGGSIGGSAHVGSAKQSLDLCELCESLSASNRALFHCFNCLHRHAGGIRANKHAGVLNRRVI